MDLRADCEHCLALCCVALAFASPADFAIDKAAGVPCPNLTGELRCGIHRDLRERGFGGCAAFDCFGAGQRVSAGAGDWRESPAAAESLFAALPVVTRLHELLWYLSDAYDRPQCASLRLELAAARDEIDALAGRPDVVLVDTEAVRASVAPLLMRASRIVREPTGRDLVRADLAGRSLRGDDLRRADLRGALLISADLRNVDLRRADLIGADLRAADLRGARLDDALYVTSAQLAAAVGDEYTALPARIVRPRHWID